MIIRPVLLCGGSGTRLWPASRESFPKQFAPLIGERSTFQETLLRVQQDALFSRPLIVTNRANRFLVERQMAEIGITGDLLLEPVARDSGPAILAASLHAEAMATGAILLVLAADHMMTRPEGFRMSAEAGLAAGRSGHLVTFGVTPTHPAVGYGYIEAGDALSDGARKVARFVEKPDATTALRYIADGYLWNSGNFLFAAQSLIGEYEQHAPDGVAAVREALAKAVPDLGQPVLDEAAFAAAPRISIDYAVMEKTTRAAVVSADCGWCDIGGWDALHALGSKDAQGNAANGDAVFMASSGSYVSSENQLVTLLGVKNVVVAATRDAVLVADMARSGEVKDLVASLKAKGREEAVRHTRVYRPWGWYQTLELHGRFQVKRIVVYPGGRLSLQTHMHRAEHWVVVKGTARVTVGDQIMSLTENQSTYIPLGAVHRLENPGRIDVEIIEVQTGSYLGEDDIIRIEDDYARS
ncbi:MAG: mannose-1-phosphate guanylyltransferase/mannose-6-phosphate isomerase [Bosea sp. (in: a-proteobacteria)]